MGSNPTADTQSFCERAPPRRGGVPGRVSASTSSLPRACVSSIQRSRPAEASRALRIEFASYSVRWGDIAITVAIAPMPAADKQNKHAHLMVWL